MIEIYDIKEITEETVREMTDRNLQEHQHDIMVDITHDLTLSKFLHDKYDLVENEMARRGLERLPPLNGFDCQY